MVQVAWTARLAAPNWHPHLVFALLVLAELAVPLTAERGRSTPWHPHHITERYSLFTIIVLGECVLASSNALKAGLSTHGVSSDVVVLGGAGLVLVFAMWWLYFLGDVSATLEGHQRTAYLWGSCPVAIYLLSQWAVHTRLHGRSSLTGVSVAVVAVATVVAAVLGSSLELPLLVVLLALPSAGLVTWELWRGTSVQRRAGDGATASSANVVSCRAREGG